MKTSSRARASLVGLVVLLLAACVVPTPIAPQSPAADQTGTASGGKWCSNVRIVYAPGQGPEGGVFASNLYNGARQAQADLGPTVEYVWSDWDPQKTVEQFKEAVARKPDGIVVIGISGDEAMDPLIDDAASQGIIVTTQTTDLPKAEARYAAQGFGYAGSELYAAGRALASEALNRFGLKEGDRAMVWGLLSQATRGERTRGAIEVLEEAGLVVDYIEIDSTTNADPPAGTPTFTGYVSSHPDVKLVVTDHGGLTATLETYLKATGKGPDDVYGAGFDLSPATVAAIRGGWTDLVADQQPWLQGYLSVLQVCLTKVYGFSGLHINTGAGFASKENIEFLAPLVEQTIR